MCVCVCVCVSALLEWVFLVTTNIWFWCPGVAFEIGFLEI